MTNPTGAQPHWFTASVTERVAFYQTRRAHLVKVRNPALSDAAWQEARRTVDFGFAFVIAALPVSLVAGIVALGQAGVWLVTDTAVPSSSVALTLVAVAAALLFIGGIAERHDASVIARTGEAKIRLPLGLAHAWADWQAAREVVNVLPSSQEAQEAMEANEARVRTALVSISTGALSPARAASAREWVYDACAKARSLSVLEVDRHVVLELDQPERPVTSVPSTESPLGEFALPSGDSAALDRALRSIGASRAARAAVRDHLR